MAKVLMDVGDMSEDDIRESLTKGVPPELLILLREVRGMLGALEQAVQVLSQSSRLSAESMATAYRESKGDVNIDTSGIAQAVAESTNKSNAAVTTSIKELSSVIAKSVPQLSKQPESVKVEHMAPVMDVTPKDTKVDFQRNEDGYLESMIVRKSVAH